MRDISADDWMLLRDTRLAALAEAPAAFASSHARETAFADDQWRDRIADSPVTFFGYADPGPLLSPRAAAAGAAGEPAGMAGVWVEDGTADLVGMWVRPAARGQGIGQALVKAGALWARERGYPALSLWVTETNGPAVALYRRCGFTPTGERQPLPSDPALTEIRMSRESG